MLAEGKHWPMKSQINHLYNTWGLRVPDEKRTSFPAECSERASSMSFVRLDVTHDTNSGLDVFAGITHFPP